jgi:hypothetical protein
MIVIAVLGARRTLTFDVLCEWTERDLPDATPTGNLMRGDLGGGSQIDPLA